MTVGVVGAGSLLPPPPQADNSSAAANAASVSVTFFIFYSHLSLYRKNSAAECVGYGLHSVSPLGIGGRGADAPVRTRLWKVALQRMADATGLTISVCHLPPGTSKWNKIERHMFCHITGNWRGRPLESLEVLVNQIASTTITKGLRLRAALDADDSRLASK